MRQYRSANVQMFPKTKLSKELEIYSLLTLEEGIPCTYFTWKNSGLDRCVNWHRFIDFHEIILTYSMVGSGPQAFLTKQGALLLSNSIW